MEISGTRRIAADTIGYSIAALLAILLIPQILKTFKHKHTLGLSIKTVVLNVVIGLLGVVYAVLIEEYPLLVGEIVVFLFSLCLFSLFFIYSKNTHNMQEHAVVDVDVRPSVSDV